MEYYGYIVIYQCKFSAHLLIVDKFIKGRWNPIGSREDSILCVDLSA
jgi:hypothetical protein